MSDPDIVLTEGQVLEIIQRTCDASWLQGMLKQPDGAAILGAACSMAAALSKVIDEQVAACKIASAPAGACGNSTLNVTRASATSSGTIPKGYKFVTHVGVDLAVAADVAVAEGQTEIALPLTTLRQIDLANTVDDTFDGALAAGDYLDDIIAPESGTVLDDLGEPLIGVGADVLTYQGSTPTADAVANWLAEHGRERGCYQQGGEDGESYRARVRQIPDAVTPAAIQSAVLGAQAQADLPDVYMVEPDNDQADSSARAAIHLVFADAPYCDDAYCDDPLGADLAGKGPFRTCEMTSFRESRAYFRESMAGSPVEPDALVAYVDESYCDDPEFGFPDVGQHPAITAAIGAVQAEAEAKRAGGVQFDVTMENAAVLNARDTGTHATGVTLWSLEPDSGKAWLIREALVTCDVSETSGIAPATDAFRLKITMADGSVAQSDWCNDPAGLPLRTDALHAIGYYAVPATKIEGIVRSTDGHVLNLVGTCWVTDYTL